MALTLASLLLGTSFAVAAEVPNLVGTWKGINSGVFIGDNEHYKSKNQGANFVDPETEFTWQIETQKGNDFVGKLSSKVASESFIGSISPNGKSAIAADEDGIHHLTIVDANTLDLCYAHVTAKNRASTCFTLKRSK